MKDKEIMGSCHRLEGLETRNLYATWVPTWISTKLAFPVFEKVKGSLQEEKMNKRSS